MANLASLLILIAFFYGRSLHGTNLRLHIRIMIGCLVADYALVLALVVVRNALGSVNTDMHWTLMVHLPFAISSIVLYALTARAGYQLLSGKPVRARLRKLDRLLVVARVMTLVTSVMVQILR